MNKIKCIFFIGTLVSLILLSPSTILYANAQDEEHEDEPDVQHTEIHDESEVEHVHVHIHEEHDELELFISVKKIVLTKSIGLFSSDESNFEFDLKNFNDGDITGIKLVLSDFTLEEETRFSDSPLFIKKQKITIEHSVPLDLEKNTGSQTITLSISDQVTKEGTYKGELTVSGEDIKPTTIEVTLKVYENIWELLQVTFLGALVSGISGFLLTHLEKKEEFERSIDDDSSIISHINGHIREINKNRSHIKEEYWKYLDDTLPIKKEAIERYRDQLALDPKAEAVEWFEKATQLLSERYLDKATHNDRDPFPEIKKPKEQSKFYLGLIKELKETSDSPKAFTDLITKKIEKKLKEYGLDVKKLTELKRSDAIQLFEKELGSAELVKERKSYDKIKTKLRKDKVIEDIWKLKKWVYFASTLLVALPTTMFVTDKFVQNPLLDVVIAFSIGFAIYRAQDIQKAFTGAVKKTPKVADKNSTPVVKVPPDGHDNGGKHNH